VPVRTHWIGPLITHLIEVSSNVTATSCLAMPNAHIRNTETAYSLLTDFTLDRYELAPNNNTRDQQWYILATVVNTVSAISSKASYS